VGDEKKDGGADPIRGQERETVNFPLPRSVKKRRGRQLNPAEIVGKDSNGVNKTGLFGVAPECETPGGRHRRIKCLPLGDSLSLTASPF